MKRSLLILIILIFGVGYVNCQSFTVDDLLALANMPSKNIDHFISKKGYVLSSSTMIDSGAMRACFIERIKSKKALNTKPKKSIDIYIKDGTKYFTLHTTDLNEYLEGERSLIKSHFFYDTLKVVTKEPSMLFQKANITIKANSIMQDSIMQYSFDLKQKVIPSALSYAEDLLQFDSHEFLINFFGEQNVKKDLYYLSEKELKKCSVLFSGTPRQAVFVWGDDINLNDLSYVIVTNVLPTEGARKVNPLSGNNEWQLKNGIYTGMALKDLLKINEMDFDIYGNKSELSFIVKPNEYGKIDFRKTAVMLSCHECFDNKIFDKKLVSALDVAKANLPMRVFDVVIYASNR
jgi:sorbitol-specific phosphotransferase system component IIA